MLIFKFRGMRMLKRKYGDRSDWKRVIKRDYSQTFLDTKEFKGYITLLKIEQVKEPLSVKFGDEDICIVNDGYFWLQHFPLNEFHSLTTMFNNNGEIVQWYIDICCENGIDESNIPWMDDLFLDIVVLPSGEVFQKDSDELEEALSLGVIDKSLYKLAREEANRLNNLINSGGFDLFTLSVTHKELLLKKMKGIE
jgi:predicted RNA-binding protein associated with RNAse of E/G family